jgi:hypothetical protein
MEKLNNMLKDIEIPSVTRVIQKFDDTLLEDPCRYLVEQNGSQIRYHSTRYEDSHYGR